jgi:hypothetical protein
VNDPEVMGRDAQQSSWLDGAARVGLVAYGAVYLLLAWVAAQVALGDKSEDASPNGALHELASQPFGRVLVWAVAAGLLLLLVWQLIEAAFGHREHEGTDRLRRRLTSVGKAVVYGALALTAGRVAVGAGSSSSSKTSRGMTAKLMDLPGGQWLVFVVGLGFLVACVVMAWQGWQEKFAEHLETEGKLGYSGAGYLLLGKVGYIAKGIAFGLVGALLCYAGLTHESEKSGGLDQALQEVLKQPFGPYLLLAMAIGLACYGLFSLAQARHLDR